MLKNNKYWNSIKVYNPIFWKKQGNKLIHRITGKIVIIGKA